MRDYLNAEMTNRFTGAVVTENLPPGATRSGDIVTISAATDLATPGYYVIIGAIVNVTGRLTLTANGVHVAFFNCVVNINSTLASPLGLTGWGAFTSGESNSGTLIAGIPGNQSISRGFHYYGSSIIKYDTGRRNIQLGDCIDCSIRALEGTFFTYFPNGARFKSSTIMSLNTGSTFQPMQINGTMANIELEELDVLGVPVLNWGQGSLTIKNWLVRSNVANPTLYVLGEGATASIPHILSESPSSKLILNSQIEYGQSTNIVVRNARVIEAMRINPIVSSDAAGVAKVAGVRCQARLGYLFNGTTFGSYTAGAQNVNYVSNASGEIRLDGAQTVGFGSTYPLVMARTGQHTGATSAGATFLSTLTDYTSEVVFRDYANDVVVSGQAQPEYRLTITRANDYTALLENDVLLMKPNAGVTIDYATSGAITGVTVDKNTATVTITETRTPTEILCYLRHYLYQYANFDVASFVSLNGVEIDFADWDVVIDGASYTGDMTTTGAITLANGATFIGTRTDANGTVAPPKTVSITGITSGSRLRIYNETTASEIYNAIVAGTSYTATYNEGTGYTIGDVVVVSASWIGGATAKLPYEAQVIVGSTGWSLLVSQQDDMVYNTNAIDGTTVTEFVFDYPNVQVDINDQDGATSITRLYAWWADERTTEQGIRTLNGGLVAEDVANYRIVSSIIDLKLDNSSPTGVIFTGDLRIYRDDGQPPVVASTSGGGSITLYAGKVFTTIVSTASPVITGDIADVPAAVQTGMTAQGYTAVRATKIDNLDVAVSTRNSVAPDNVGVAAIKAKTDNLPIDPASETTAQSGVDAAKLAAALSA